MKEPIEKYFKKEVLNLSDKSKIKESIEKMIFGVFYLSDSIENFSFPFPHIKGIPTCYFATENNILTSEMFNIFYIFKTLSLSIKSTNVNDLLHPEKTKRSITTTAGVHILSNHMFNKTFHDWRPIGVLKVKSLLLYMTTIKTMSKKYYHIKVISFVLLIMKVVLICIE